MERKKTISNKCQAYINEYLKQTNRLHKIYNIKTKMKMEIL